MGGCLESSIDMMLIHSSLKQILVRMVQDRDFFEGWWCWSLLLIGFLFLAYSYCNFWSARPRPSPVGHRLLQGQEPSWSHCRQGRCGRGVVVPPATQTSSIKVVVTSTLEEKETSCDQFVGRARVGNFERAATPFQERLQVTREWHAWQPESGDVSSWHLGAAWLPSESSTFLLSLDSSHIHDCICNLASCSSARDDHPKIATWCRKLVVDSFPPHVYIHPNRPLKIKYGRDSDEIFWRHFSL